MVLDRQCAVEAGKEFPNLVIGEEGHVNNCRILSPSERTSSPIQTSEQRGIVLWHMHTPNHTAYHIQFGGWLSGPSSAKTWMVLDLRPRPTTLVRMVEKMLSVAYFDSWQQFSMLATRLNVLCLTSSAALQPVSQHSWGINVSAVVIKLADIHCCMSQMSLSSSSSLSPSGVPSPLRVRWNTAPDPKKLVDGID